MANTFVPVNPVKPAAATETLIYQVPDVGGTTAMLLSLIAANNSGSAGAPDTITVRRLLDGETLSTADREILGEVVVNNQDTFIFNDKLLLGQDEQLTVESANGDIVFTASIIEFSA